MSSRWCEQGPSEALSFPLLPSRLEARLLNSVLSISFSVESPFLSFSTLASQSRLPSLSQQNHLLIRVDRRLDVQAASPTAQKGRLGAFRFSISPGRFHTITPSFARFENTSTPRERLFPHIEPFLRSLRSLASKPPRTRLENPTVFHKLNLFTKPSFLSRSVLRHTSTPLLAKPTNSSP